MHDIFSRLWLQSVIFQTFGWTWQLLFFFSFLCNEILRCVIFRGSSLIFMQICPRVLSPLLIHSPLLPWTCHLAVRCVDSRPPVNQAFLYIRTHWLRGKVSALSPICIADNVPFSPQTASACGWGTNGRCMDDTVAHECHIIRQSVTGCRPASPRDAVDL